MTGILAFRSVGVMARDTHDGQESERQPAYGQWGGGIAIGLAIGVAFGVAMHNLGAGIAIGIGIGIAFSMAFDEAGRRRRNGRRAARNSPRPPNGPDKPAPNGGDG